MQGAGGVGGLLAEISPSASEFVCFDGNGNVKALVDTTSSSLVAQYEHGPFGEFFLSTGSMALFNPFRFSTKYQDAETDFLYYGYRFYNLNVGRWLSKDPIEEAGGQNLYAFSRNDQVNQIDYVGLCPPGGCALKKFGKDKPPKKKTIGGWLIAYVLNVEAKSGDSYVSVKATTVNSYGGSGESKAKVTLSCDASCKIGVDKPHDADSTTGSLPTLAVINVTGADGTSDTASVAWDGAAGADAVLSITVGSISITPPANGIGSGGGYTFKCIRQ